MVHLLLLITFASASLGSGESSCSSQSSESSEELHLNVGLLQVHSDFKQNELPPVPQLMPLARSLTSPDPEGAADYMIRHYGAKRVNTNLTSPCVDVVGVEMSNGPDTVTMPVDKYTMYFVKDTRKFAGPLPRDTFEKASDKHYSETIYSGEALGWQEWEDVHDGTQTSTINLTHLHEMNAPVQLGLLGVYMNIPNTSWALEIDNATFFPSPSQADLDWYHNVQIPKTFLCRDGGAILDSQRYWKKATYVVESTKLDETVDFIQKALGAVRKPSAYPHPQDDDECIAARWFGLTNADGEIFFDIHIVKTVPPFPSGHPNTKDFNDYQGAIRDLDSGQFDHYLYNSLIMWADTLDPFIERLQILGAPFLVMKLQDNIFSLVFSLPQGQGFNFDIRSASLTVVEPQEFDPCSVQ